MLADGLSGLEREKNRPAILVHVQRFGMGVFASEFQVFQQAGNFHRQILSGAVFMIEHAQPPVQAVSSLSEASALR